MPSIVTHYYNADKVIKSLNTKDYIYDCIKKYPKEFNIGTQGADIWLYHCGAPWSDSKLCEKSNNWAELVHNYKINLFYKTCLERIANERNEDLKEAMISYVAGHLCHWGLDSTCHPYIFYKTYGKSPETKYWHVRLEEEIDNVIIKKMKKEHYSVFPIHKIISFDDMTVKAIDAIYNPCLKALDSIDLPEGFVKQALKDFKTIIRFVYDPIGLFYSIIRLYELIVNDKWHFTCHFINCRINHKDDILNNNHSLWTNPIDDTDVHHESFMELFEIGRQKSVKVLEAFEKSLVTKNEKELLDVLQGRDYEFNLLPEQQRLFKYYDVIYK